MERNIAKLIVCILIASSLLFGMGSYEILHFPQDARSLSLHNAASAYDRSLLRNNPAALSLVTEKTIYSYLALPASIHSGEIQHIRRIGGGISAGKLSYIDYGSIVDGKTHESTTASDMLIEIGYKKEYKKIVSVGISGGYLLSSISGYHSHLLYTNIGIRSRIMKRKIGLGISLENIGLILSSYTNIKESIPAIFRSAFYYRPKYLPVIISVDIISSLDRDATDFSGGLEYIPGEFLIFRLGCSSHRTDFLTGDFSSDLIADVSGGVGVQFNKINLDVGFMNLGATGYVVGFSISKMVG